MKKTLILTSLLLAKFFCCAQGPTPAFGKIDTADLQLKQCDFEKDANAMVLFDKANVYFDQNFNVVLERHKRIKIFNEKGNDEAKITIEYISGSNLEYISGIQAETINMVNGKPEITKVDKKLIYTQAVDKFYSNVVFAFPNVKPGSVIEFKYRVDAKDYDLPSWYFQSDIPVKYSELTTSVPEFFIYKTQAHLALALSKNTKGSESGTMPNGNSDPILFNSEINCRGMSNIPSLRDEPFMRSRVDNLESIEFELTGIKPVVGFVHNYADTWQTVSGAVIEDEDFGSQMRKKLTGEDIIIAKAKTLHSADEKIAYIFKEVRDRMKWNDVDRWYTIDGTPKAWDSKTGNSTEINIILYHLLKQVGIDGYPMLVSTRKNGKVNPFNASIHQFNHTIVYIPVDSATHYFLDASNKYNMYNQTPSEFLTTFGLWLDKENKKYDIMMVQNNDVARQVVMVNAEIKPDGKMEGTAEISSASYYKTNNTALYKKEGEEKYKTFLRDDDNNISISAIKMENMDVDTLPLSQKLDFKATLAGSDGDYIYFNPNLFTGLHKNPFLSEIRATDIDFEYRKSYSIIGAYKKPGGFKTEALPKNVTIVMPDQSVIFKRFVNEEDGVIHVNYTITHKNAVYFKENYGDLREFYKKMNEMLNEQIVLKKG